MLTIHVHYPSKEENRSLIQEEKKSFFKHPDAHKNLTFVADP